jgi:hypothetical protein
MNCNAIILTTSMFFGLLVTAVLVPPKSARAQSPPEEAKRIESPFACNRLALTPEQRKRHFDELGPALRSLRKSVRELPNGYGFEFPADSKTIELVAEWAQWASVPAARSSTLTCGWSAKAGRSG